MTRPTQVPFTERARSYFQARGISATLAHDCGVREIQGCIAWPARDADGRLSPRYRRLSEGPGPKVRGLKGRTLGVWWPAGTPDDPEDVLVCEGESDALAALTALGPSSHISVAALPGASFPARVLAAELHSVGATVAAVAFDGDGPGGSNAERLAWELASQGIGARILAVPFGEDLASVLGNPETPAGWLERALLSARPVGLVEAALVAENNWLRRELLRLTDGQRVAAGACKTDSTSAAD